MHSVAVQEAHSHQDSKQNILSYRPHFGKCVQPQLPIEDLQGKASKQK